MNAVEFNITKTDGPNPALANAVRAEALKQGLILLSCGVHGNVIRFLVSIKIGDDVFAETLDILEDAVMAAKASL